MSPHTRNDSFEKKEQRDKALINRCVDGLGLYAALKARESKHTSKIKDLQELANRIVDYWGLDSKVIQMFNCRNNEARTIGVVAGSAYQASHNVIYGLYRYCMDIIESQGSDSMGEVLDVSDLMKEIAAAWEFESDILEDMTDELNAVVHTMYDGTPILGQSVSGVFNVGYEITLAAMFENGLGIVLAHNPDAPSPFVTWRYGMDENGSNWYELGHYFSTEIRAKIDYALRIFDYMARHGVKVIPFSFAATEVDAEQQSQHN